MPKEHAPFHSTTEAPPVGAPSLDLDKEFGDVTIRRDITTHAVSRSSSSHCGSSARPHSTSSRYYTSPRHGSSSSRAGESRIPSSPRVVSSSRTSSTRNRSQVPTANPPEKNGLLGILGSKEKEKKTLII